jgi:hypothetical protein
MAEDLKKDELFGVDDKKSNKDDIDVQIDMERRRQEALKKATDDDSDKKLLDDKKALDADKSRKTEDVDKITVNRDYIKQIRDEAKKYRLDLEESKKATSVLQDTLKKHFDVDTPEKLAEKLEEAKRMKEKEEETKLSRVEIAEKRAQKLEKEMEEERIKSEQKVNELIKSRDDMIIRHGLIQAAVAHDVANPKQLLQLLKDEFYVDPDRLVPLYKAEDGTMSLDERVKVFLEDTDNWNLVKSKIREGSGSQGSIGSSGKTLFTKADLSKMRNENPAEYKRLQPEILKAYADGRVK